MGSIKKEMEAQCAAKKTIMGPRMVPMLDYVVQSMTNLPGFKKIEPSPIVNMMKQLSGIFKAATKTNICDKAHTKKLYEEKMQGLIMINGPGLLAHYQDKCQNYYDHMGTAEGQQFLAGISQRIKAM